MIKHILWDWNGTLLDDAECAHSVINLVLEKHGLPLIADVDEYRSAFCFPVIKYYEHVGLGGESYDEAAKEWIAEYTANEADAKLRQEALPTLEAIKNLGLTQAVISASPKSMLISQVASRGIAHYFDALLGLDDIHARSKIHLAHEYMQEMGMKPEETLFIGDTDHDAEVAAAVHCHCVLLLGGHQLPEKLGKIGCPVLGGMAELPRYIKSL